MEDHKVNANVLMILVSKKIKVGKASLRKVKYNCVKNTANQYSIDEKMLSARIYIVEVYPELRPALEVHNNEYKN